MKRTYENSMKKRIQNNDVKMIKKTKQNGENARIK